MRTYTTVQGDMWDSIAYQEMGSVYNTSALMQANMQYHDYFSFPSGIQLAIPDTDRKNAAENLPPWKR